METPKLLRELNEGDFFKIKGQSYRLLSLHFDGAVCEDSEGLQVLFSRYEIVELAELQF